MNIYLCVNLGPALFGGNRIEVCQSITFGHDFAEMHFEGNTSECIELSKIHSIHPCDKNGDWINE